MHRCQGLDPSPTYDPQESRRRGKREELELGAKTEQDACFAFTRKTTAIFDMLK